MIIAEAVPVAWTMRATWSMRIEADSQQRTAASVKTGRRPSGAIHMQGGESREGRGTGEAQKQHRPPPVYVCQRPHN